MEDQYGSDFITIVDEDGTEFELEVLVSTEYNGQTYMAVTLAGAEEGQELEISILKSVDEDGESVLCAIEDEKELEEIFYRTYKEGNEERRRWGKKQGGTKRSYGADASYGSHSVSSQEGTPFSGAGGYTKSHKGPQKEYLLVDGYNIIFG